MSALRGATALALFVGLAFHAFAVSTTESSSLPDSALAASPSEPVTPALPTGLTARIVLSDLAAGGEAAGRLADGRVVFVPGGAPDEVVEVSLDELRKGYVRSTLRRIVTPSASRLTPPCPLASPGRCGGCPLMHLSREAQLAAKHSWTSRAVRHSGAEVLPMVAPTPPLHYRLRVRIGVTGGQLSFAKARSLGRQSISQCLVLRPELSTVLFVHTSRLVELLGSGGAIAGLVGMHQGRPRVQLMVELAAGKSRAPVLTELRRLIADEIIVGAILGEETLGVATLDIGEDLGPLGASADGFAQASAPGHSLLPKLVAAAVVEGWTRPPSLLELYAGSGNLTRALLGLGGPLTAVEGEPRAAARLQALADTVQAAAPLTVQALSVEKALPQLVREGLRADVIVLDPPRSGARSIIPMLGALSARRIVYVSCDAMTLGRDLEALKDFGYKPRTVQPIDLMPHTAEVECVAVLDR